MPDEFIRDCGLAEGSPEAEIALKIRKVFAEQFSHPENEITADMTGGELIAPWKPKHWWEDGPDYIELVMALEEAFGLDIPDEVAEKLFFPAYHLKYTVRDFVTNYLERLSRLDEKPCQFPVFRFFPGGSRFEWLVALSLMTAGILAIAGVVCGMYPWPAIIPAGLALLFPLYTLKRTTVVCDRFNGEIRQGKRKLDLSLYRAVRPLGEYVNFESIDYWGCTSLEFLREKTAAKRAGQIAVLFNLPLEPFSDPSSTLYRAHNPADWGIEARPFFRAVAAVCTQAREAGHAAQVLELEDRLRKSCRLADSRRYVAEFQRRRPESTPLEALLVAQLQKLLREAALMATPKNPGFARQLREISAGLGREASGELLSLAGQATGGGMGSFSDYSFAERETPKQWDLVKEISNTIDEIRLGRETAETES